MTQPLRSRRITRPSSLLRVVPPLCFASVLSSSRGVRLDFSLGIEATGSKVPCPSLICDPAVFVPDAAWAGYRLLPCLSQSKHHTLVSTSTRYGFDTSSTVHLRSTSQTLPDAIESRLLHPTFPTTALDRCSSGWFVAWSCHPATRGLLSSQTQLLLAHGGSPFLSTIVHPLFVPSSKLGLTRDSPATHKAGNTTITTATHVKRNRIVLFSLTSVGRRYPVGYRAWYIRPYRPGTRASYRPRGSHLPSDSFALAARKQSVLGSAF